MRRRLLLGPLTLAVLLTLTLAGPAAAPPAANVTIHELAAWESPAHITVAFDATCTGGTGSITLQVATQPPAPPASGLGTAPVVCDGAKHDGAITIGGGPWQPGPALARAVLFQPSGGGDTDLRVIQIVV